MQAREYDLQLEAKLGKRRLVTEATPQAQVGGYWCEVCQCTLRDNMTYLDHINGRPHQARLGFSVRAERATVDQVKARFERLKAQKAGGGSSAGAASGAGRVAALDADDRYALAAMDAPSIQMVAADKASVHAAPAGASSSSSSSSAAAAAPAGAKRPRWDNAAGSGDGAQASSASSLSSASSAAPKGGSAPPPAAAAAPSDGGGGEEEIDPELAAMMGFSGFGGGKNR